MADLKFNVSAGRNIEACVEGDYIVLRVKTNGPKWVSKGKAQSILAASTSGFININGYKIGMNVIAPDGTKPTA